MTMIAYAFLQHRRLSTARREKKNQRKTRRAILFASIIIFAFRAAPSVGDGYFWWTSTSSNGDRTLRTPRLIRAARSHLAVRSVVPLPTADSAPGFENVLPIEASPQPSATCR